jgi:hypothetical protein
MHASILTRGLFLCCLLAGAPLAAQQSSELERAAAALGLPASSLREGHVATISLTQLGVELTRVKGVDHDGATRLIDLLPDGRAADLAELRLIEQALVAQDPLRKCAAALTARIAAAASGERLPVVAWIAFDGDELDAHARERCLPFAGRMPTRAEADAAGRDIRQHVMARIGQRLDAFETALAAEGIALRFRSRTVPMVILDLSLDELASVAARTDVVALELDDSDMHAAGDVVNDTHRTTWVQTKGVRGGGVRVAVHEQGAIDPACPYLSVSGWYTLPLVPVEHVHATAGCIASSKADRPGSAPDVELYSANALSWSYEHIFDAADWIATQDIDITNMSWGGNEGSTSYDTADTYFDFASHYLRDSYVASAGNNGLGAPVGSPAKAYNVITVGSFDEHADWDWSNDSLSSFSSTLDPVSGCEKPNIVAVGTSVDTLGYPAPWTVDGNNGTSFSAPHAAGNLADAMGINSQLAMYPEAAMALLMATAWNNIEGDSLLSAFDGAGGIDGYAAYQCAKDNRIASGYFTESDFDTEPVQLIYLEGGQLTRVCVAWSATPYLILGVPVGISLSTDLDIEIITNPTGSTHTILATSSSLTNNFELVDFTPSTTGWYGVRIGDNGTITASTLQAWGMAWTQEGDQQFIQTAENANFTPDVNGYLSGPTIGHKAFDFGFSTATPGQPYAMVPTGTPGGGFPSQPSGGVWIPLMPDLLTSIWLATAATGAPWTNSIGSSGLDGLVEVGMSLPANAGLVGKPLVHVGLLLDAQAGIELVTKPFVRTILPKPLPVPEQPAPTPVALPFSVPFYGVPHDTVWVSEDGFVAFAQTGAAPGESAAALLAGAPRIAVLWDDLDRHTAGASLQMRLVDKGERQLVVEWIRLGEAGGGPGAIVTARLVLHANGVIETGYVVGKVQDGIVGVSPGQSLSDASPLDLSSSGELVGGPHEALYQVFGPSSEAFDLGATPQDDGQLVWNELRYVPTEAGGYRVDVTLH